jgi:hypothetical protein
VKNDGKRELMNALNGLIFKGKCTLICECELRIVIEKQDTHGLRLLANFTRAMDTIFPFALEFLFELEAAAKTCFKKEKLYRALTDFYE